ncbi:hypothetical protein [Cellulosimicrobium sp. CUA-896]|uniref:hypothetical protein n=1 Tax=Cellulosimicrobium sp. CUA-896 TaxID=1517881 RepID=UPI003515EB8B
MAKSPASRYPTVLAFARALQQVQNELSLAVTPIDLLDDTGHVHEEEPDDDAGTRLRQVVSIDPAGPATTPPGGPAYPPHLAPAPPAATAGTSTGTAPGAHDGTSGLHGTTGTRPTSGVGPSAPLSGDGTAGAAAASSVTAPPPAARPTWGAAPVEDTVHRAAPAPTRDDEPAQERAGGGRARWAVLSGVLVLAVAGAGVLALVRGGDDDAAEADPTPTSDRTFTPSDNLGALVPPVNDLTGAYDAAQGAVVFTWAYDSPDAQEGDTFGWKKLDLVGDAGTQPTTEPTAVVPAEPGEQVCVEVVVVRDGRASATPQTACVPEVEQG